MLVLAEITARTPEETMQAVLLNWVLPIVAVVVILLLGRAFLRAVSPRFRAWDDRQSELSQMEEVAGTAALKAAVSVGVTTFDEEMRRQLDKGDNKA